MSVEFLAEGRIVWGHPVKAQQKTDPRTKQVIKDDQGNPVEQWVFGLAVPKAKWDANVYPFMYQEALTAFPSGNFPQNFSWKFKDGDTATDSKGNPYNQMEGRAGCMILTISTENFAPPLYKFENGQYVQVDANSVKCGDHVAVKIECKFNGATGVNTPGLYINPRDILIIGYDKEIQSTGGGNPQESFAGYTPQVPAGVSATPTMPTSAPMPQSAPPAMNVQIPQQQAAPAPQPMAAAPMPAPAYDIIHNAGQQPAGNVAPVAAAPQPATPPVAHAATTAYPSNPAPVAPMPQQQGVPGLPQGR